MMKTKTNLRTSLITFCQSFLANCFLPIVSYLLPIAIRLQLIAYSLLPTFSFAQTNGTGAGNCLNYNGTSDYVSINPPVILTDNFSFESWIYPAQIPTSSFNAAISYGFDDGFSGNGIAIGISDSTLTVLFSGIVFFNTGYNFPNANEWYHITVVRNNEFTRAYVNGIQTPNGTAQTPIAPTQFRIGSQTNIRYFNGQIDEVRFWGRALTQTEIQTNMCQKLKGTEAGLVGYWRFDVVTGNTVVDSSPNGNNGTLY